MFLFGLVMNLRNLLLLIFMYYIVCIFKDIVCIIYVLMFIYDFYFFMILIFDFLFY